MQKIKSYTTLLFTLFFISLSLSGNGQTKKWTLEDCINYALDNNINVKRQMLLAEQQRNNKKQKKFNILPSIEASGRHSFQSGKTINYDTYSYVNQDYNYEQMSVSGDITLFNGLENLNAIKRSKYDLLAQLESIKEAKYNVTLNVMTNYLNVLSSIEQKRIREEQLKVTLEQIEQTRQQVELGNVAKGELLKIKSQAATERVSLTNAKNDLKIAYLDLMQLMNLDTAANFNIQIPDHLKMKDTSDIRTADNIFSQAVKEYPSIQNARYQLESNKQNLKIQKSRLLPNITFSAYYGTYYNELSNTLFPYETQLKENANLALTLRLNIPIFDKFRKKTSINNAKIDIKDTRYLLEESKQNLHKNIQRARNEATAAYKNYLSNQEAVKSSEETFTYTEERYNLGLVDLVEYRIAKNDLSRAKSDLVYAKYNYIFRLKILDFYLGKELKFN